MTTHAAPRTDASIRRVIVHIIGAMPCATLGAFQFARRQAPAGYRLRVDGHLDQHWSAWFGNLTVTHESDGTTSLSGFVPDQAALHGLLMKVRDLGLTLISVEVIDASESGGRRRQEG